MREDKGVRHSNEDIDVKTIIDNLVNDLVSFIGGLFRKQETIDEFVKKFSDKTDKIIIEESEKGNVYGAGRFFIKWKDDISFRYSFELYFKTKEGQFQKVAGDKESVPIKFLKEESRNELREKKEIVYDIESPNMRNNKDNETQFDNGDIIEEEANDVK